MIYALTGLGDHFGRAIGGVDVKAKLQHTGCVHAIAATELQYAGACRQGVEKTGQSMTGGARPVAGITLGMARVKAQGLLVHWPLPEQR